MKRFLIAVTAALLTIPSCTASYHSTSRPAVVAEDVVYLHDSRTGLCFAVLFIENPARTSLREMSMTAVPCASIPDSLRR